MLIIFTMRIYVKNLMPEKINISSIKPEITHYRDIYSVDGIFRIQNNNISKLIPQDVTQENFNYNNTEFIIDKSSYIFRKNIYAIPYEHVSYNIEQIEYKLDKKSLVSLVVKYHKRKIVDIYFSTKNNICTNLKNNIMEYISLFNDIKQS